jgi:VanZ family protein
VRSTPERLFIAWAPVIAWAVLIFVFSAQPDLRFLPDDNLDFVVRKVGHMGVFGILALLILRGVDIGSWPRPRTWALTLTALYAATDELHQATVAGRHASVVDVAIDVAGAVIAIGIVGLVKKARG